MSEPNLGHLIGEGDDVNRDAIHVAVVPMTAGEDLSIGSAFRLGSTDQYTAYNGNYGNAVGIVDPFLNASEVTYWRVEKGQKFWGFLFPGTVTGMRHHWMHPAFKERTDSIPAFNDREYEYQEAWACCAGEVYDEDHWQQDEAEESYRWLQDFCDRWNFDLTELIAQATKSGDNRESWDRYIVANGHDLHNSGDLGEDHNLFWKHLETYTGEKYDDDHRLGMGWSCSC